MSRYFHKFLSRKPRKINRTQVVDNWNQTKECCTSTGKVEKELNRYIDTMRAKVLQILRELEIGGIRITADAIRDKLYGRDESQKTLIEVYAEHNKRCQLKLEKTLPLPQLRNSEHR